MSVLGFVDSEILNVFRDQQLMNGLYLSALVGYCAIQLTVSNVSACTTVAARSD